MNKENLKVKIFDKNIIYIENAFPESNEFIEFIEENNNNSDIANVIPPWSKWVDGSPKKIIDKNKISWVQEMPDGEDSHRGDFKVVNWDLDAVKNMSDLNILFDLHTLTAAHKKCLPIIENFEKGLIESIKVWCNHTDKDFPVYLTRNYNIRRYRPDTTGSSMGEHIDRNKENPSNTMDWSALAYLNDDYKGGEIFFTDLNLKIKPSAGSILFFPCETKHLALPVKNAHKYYIFLFMDTSYGIFYSLGEQVDSWKYKFNPNLFEELETKLLIQSN